MLAVILKQFEAPDETRFAALPERRPLREVIAASGTTKHRSVLPLVPSHGDLRVLASNHC